MSAPDAISGEKRSKLIGTPRCPVLLNVWREALRASDPRLLFGARRLGEANLSSITLEQLAVELTGQSVVVVCAEATAGVRA